MCNKIKKFFHGLAGSYTYAHFTSCCSCGISCNPPPNFHWVSSVTVMCNNKQPTSFCISFGFFRPNRDGDSNKYRHARQNFIALFVHSTLTVRSQNTIYPSRFFCDPVVSDRVNLLPYESKPTDKRGQYNWRAEKNCAGYPDYN